MEKSKKYKKEPKESKINEPSAVYGKPSENRLVFFNSYEEMNEFDLQEMAKSTPEERFKHVTYLIQHLYADVLKNKLPDMKIYFD
jgi:hypothetical protein